MVTARWIAPLGALAVIAAVSVAAQEAPAPPPAKVEDPAATACRCGEPTAMSGQGNFSPW